MNAKLNPSVASEINRLHHEVETLLIQSRQSLDSSLIAAWRAGQLLNSEKKRVRANMGPSSWLLWLEANFHGAPRTAQRYMKLAKSVADDAFLQGMSLRQAYSRLGIATEPKSKAGNSWRHQLPAHVVLANRLVRALKHERRRIANDEVPALFRQDLRTLFETLRPWFTGV